VHLASSRLRVVTVHRENTWLVSIRLTATPSIVAGCLFTMNACSIAPASRQIAYIHAVGITGNVRHDQEYTEMESILDGLTAIFAREGFRWPGKDWAQAHGKRYDYGWYLSGERVYSLSYVFEPTKDSFVQCTVGIDRKKATLKFFESESPFKSGRFPMTKKNRQHVRATARVVADYLRRRLPSHDAQISFEEEKS
jgi:hypothetical protein